MPEPTSSAAQLQGAFPMLIPYEFDPATVDLLIEGLGHLPYRRVAGTIQQIATHAHATLNPPPEPKPKRQRKSKTQEPTKG